METKLKITIPKPCHEDWNAMTPDETGRFCNVCTKQVLDFTNKTTEEIQQYFVQNQRKDVCGRFKNEQVNRLEIQIPRSLLKRKMSFHKAFLLSLFIAMGSTLFSCKNHNNDYVTGEPVVVEDTVQQRGMTTGMVLPKREHVVDTTQVEPKIIYSSAKVEIKPMFPGGMPSFYKYISSNLKISEQNKKITGTFIVSFVVEIDGKLSDIKIIKGINEEMNSEVIRVFQSSIPWIPGKINNQNVRVSYFVPIKITAEF
ncbi:energy transducer TonB [Flavobacterium aciduliphilum]|uniref:TonB-like protein n=1 Tax=Flavobacterium aciduliphilum TaxID=1101402 RepID=A0A328YLE1_9FLAO|nr:energy transducer TonB [Flavobacterium aciduliphilum]RAR72922.1 TonB-like protein [Flavobacterium aciduliphilum]